MKGVKKAAAILGGTALIAGAGSAYGAYTLYKRVIPRQMENRVDLNEMADMAQWEEYKKIIHANKDWLSEREMEHLTIKSRDGLTLHGDYIPADEDADTIVICFHGYTSNGWDSCSSVAAFFLREGYDCLVVDNRAHGKSEGAYVGFGILDRFDCLCWMNYVNERFDFKKNIVLYGVSMGAATVVMASGFKKLPKNLKAIISDCAFTSPYDVFAHILKRDYHLPEFPVMNFNDMLTKKTAGYGFKDYSTLNAVTKTSIPILFIHGEKDDFVPTEMSYRNYNACNSPCELLIVENAGHAAAYYENVPLYEKKVKEFLNKYL
ncbi:MAG: alpha/beta hydrolase [Clostridia bacterium]|nr:alpha/beta hydrolase [Clostridia bacterium]